MVICFTVVAMLVAAGIPLRRLGMIVASLLGLVLLYALAKPYARQRLTSFIDPWAHATTSGFQAVQGQIAIGSGGLLGVGPGQSVQKIFYLPEAQTDFILAVIARGGRGRRRVRAALPVRDDRVRRAARGAESEQPVQRADRRRGDLLIVSQALLNMFAVLGLAPLTGVPLPLVSYGSSSMIVMLAAMGLLLNVASGATGHVRAVSQSAILPGDARGREQARLGDEQAQEDRDRRRRDRWARRAGAGGRTGAAG